MSIRLLNSSNADLLVSLPLGRAAGVHADPAWSYSSGKSGGSGTSAAGDVYRCESMADIAATLDDAAERCYPDAYLAMWATFPLLAEWFATPLTNWRYVSGAAWGKTDNRTGMGYHFRGDAELLLLYRKGRPIPYGGSKSNLWLADRGSHSEKPQAALTALATMMGPPGALILDLWAGESGSFARACQTTGRHYLGAELDPERHARALRRIAGDSAAQAAMRGQERLF